jgi:hypothetical protein
MKEKMSLFLLQLRTIKKCICIHEIKIYVNDEREGVPEISFCGKGLRGSSARVSYLFPGQVWGSERGYRMKTFISATNRMRMSALKSWGPCRNLNNFTRPHRSGNQAEIYREPLSKK